MFVIRRGLWYESTGLSLLLEMVGGCARQSESDGCRETFVYEGVEDGMTTKQVECPYDRARPVKATTVGGEARGPGAVWLRAE